MRLAFRRASRLDEIPRCADAIVIKKTNARSGCAAPDTSNSNIPRRRSNRVGVDGGTTIEQNPRVDAGACAGGARAGPTRADQGDCPGST